MTRSLVALLAVAAAGALPAAASASCYFVYSAKNELVYRSTISPVDLSRPISESLRGRFAGGHLVMIPTRPAAPTCSPTARASCSPPSASATRAPAAARRRRSTPRRCSRTTPVPGRAADTVGAETPSDVVSPQRGRRSAPTAPASTARRPSSTAPRGR
jgi:hypothetical protein